MGVSIEEIIARELYSHSDNPLAYGWDVVADDNTIKAWARIHAGEILEELHKAGYAVVPREPTEAEAMLAACQKKDQVPK